MEKESSRENYKMLGLAFGQALGLIVYCVLIGLVLWRGEYIFGPMKHFMGPVLFLVLFVASALISALLMLGYPVYLMWEKKRVTDGLRLIIYSTGWLVLFVIIGLTFFALRSVEQEKSVVSKETGGRMVVEEAMLIAQDSECAGKGDLTDNYMYNESTRTRWIDLGMKEEFKKDICNPACVISEESQTAEINWRCTGLISQ